MKTQVSLCPAYRAVYFALGWVLFGLGVLGAILPVMPSTVFMIAALWAFAHSSQRFHDWLYHHKIFGPSLQSWQTHRVIPLCAKYLAVGSMGVSLTYLILFSSAPTIAVVSSAIFMTWGAVYILSKPSRVPNNQRLSSTTPP